MSAGRSLSLFLQVLGLIVVQCGTVYTSTVKDDTSPSDGTCPVILPWLCNASSLDLSKLCLTFNRDYSRELCSTSCDGSVYQRLLDHPPSAFGADMSAGRSLSLFLQLTSSALRLLVKAMAALPFLRLSEIHRFFTGESRRCLGKRGDDKRKRLKGSQGSRGHIPFSTPAGRGQTVLAKDRRSTAALLLGLSAELAWTGREGNRRNINDKNKAKVARALVLAAKGQATEIRVNTRLNIAAVDTEERATLEELLAVTVVQNIKVKTHLTRPKAQSTGIVHPRFSAGTREEVQENIQAPVSIQGPQVFTGGHTIRVHFDGPLRNDAGNRGRLGHVCVGRTTVNACATCPEAHKKGTGSRADSPSCPNCTQRHGAFDWRCPAYMQARNVAREINFSGRGWRAAKARLARRSAAKRQRATRPATANKEARLKSKLNDGGSCS
ncbi:hypothetical protein HPB47_020868 [Ixodes persulcatus]|uniref:Uncharacterized protein n=1 Tax=Ixodes persulcatus TaxID=34615 RepID=A0AC60QGC8_IXOPE|nr:hypothetical protein HPB47_020868 [Ixodes persulcatus]